MNDEETILDSQYTTESNTSEGKKNIEEPQKDTKKSTTWAEKSAYAVGGAVVGAGLTSAGHAMAANHTEDPTEASISTNEKNGKNSQNENVAATASYNNEENVQASTTVSTDKEEEKNDVQAMSNDNVTAKPTQEDIHTAQHGTENRPTTHHVESLKPEDSPAPEDTIVATATGVRVAQVDDDKSFAEAFADARAQVGAGGVFEWHGRAYSTYYKEEWDHMSPAERQDYQAAIDYNDVISEDNTGHNYNNMSHHNESNVQGTTNESAGKDPVTEARAESSDESRTEDVEVHVLEVGQVDLNQDGIPENAAVLEVDGHEVLVVDIDQDQIADVAICDINNDGEVEVADLRGENMTMPEMSEGDAYMAESETAPDYMNDANVNMFEA